MEPLPDAASVPIPDVDDLTHMMAGAQVNASQNTYYEQWLQVAQYEDWEVTCVSVQTSNGMMAHLSLVWKHASDEERGTFTDSWPCRPRAFKVSEVQGEVAVDVYETWVVDDVHIERLGPRPRIRLTWRLVSRQDAQGLGLRSMRRRLDGHDSDL